jgi:hypothetical protein
VWQQERGIANPTSTNAGKRSMPGMPGAPLLEEFRASFDGDYRLSGLDADQDLTIQRDALTAAGSSKDLCRENKWSES